MPKRYETALPVSSRFCLTLPAAGRSHRILTLPDAARGAAACSALDKVIARLRDPGGPVCAGLLVSGTLHRGRIELMLDDIRLADELGMPAGELSPDLLQLTASFDLRRRGVEARIVAGTAMPQPDPHLCAILIRVHGWALQLRSGTQLSDIARREKVPGSYVRSRAQIAFLSPKIQTAILNGTQPTDLSLKRLISTTLPLDWGEQERMFGF